MFTVELRLFFCFIIPEPVLPSLGLFYKFTMKENELNVPPAPPNSSFDFSSPSFLPLCGPRSLNPTFIFFNKPSATPIYIGAAANMRFSVAYFSAALALAQTALAAPLPQTDSTQAGNAVDSACISGVNRILVLILQTHTQQGLLATCLDHLVCILMVLWRW